MKHLFELNEMEKWEKRTIESLKFDRDKDIEMYLIELTDMGWVLAKSEHAISDCNFEVKSRINYVNGGLYKQYLFEFTNKKILTMDRTIELLGSLASAVERLKDAGYIFKILNLTIGSEQAGNKKLRLLIYHNEDEVPWETVFTI